MKGKFFKMLIVPVALAALLAGCGSQTGNNAPSNTTSNTTGTETGSGTGSQTGGETGEETGSGTASGLYGHEAALADNDLTEAEMLKYAIEDEYAARSEYEAVVGKFGEVGPFVNIVNAEQNHIDALKTLYGYRNMEVPADSSKSHVVLPATLEEAKDIGEQAEIKNIAMYEKFLSQSNLPDDMKRVFTSLKEASEQHLEAFRK